MPGEASLPCAWPRGPPAITGEEEEVSCRLSHGDRPRFAECHWWPFWLGEYQWGSGSPAMSAASDHSLMITKFNGNSRLLQKVAAAATSVNVLEFWGWSVG
jgi:hypothetical protein